MIDYGLFQFACPPHTGASWFIKAAQLAGLGPGFEYKAHTNFSGNGKSLKVSLVRNPFDWLTECYRGLIDGSGYTTELGVISQLNHSSFFDLIQDFLALEEGTIEQIYDNYQADVVMRFEDQPWALIELLESLGVPSQLRQKTTLISRIGPFTSSTTSTTYIVAIYREVIQRERKLCEKYDYY